MSPNNTLPQAKSPGAHIISNMNLVVTPFVNGPNADLSFHRFVDGLVHSTVNAANNVLILQGEGAYLFDNIEPDFGSGNSMFIRPVYAPLTNLIDEGLGDARPVMVTGTPGVGKTTMRNWYAKHLVTTPFGPEEQARTIFLHSSDNPEYFMIKMERIVADPVVVDAPGVVDPGVVPVVPVVQVRVTASTGRNILVERKVVTPIGMAYSLVDVETLGTCKDVSSSPTSRAQDRLVLFASPSSKAIDKFRKKILRVFYMPLWTLAELQTANEALGLGLTEATIVDRYTRIGGMARYVLVRDQVDFDTYTNETLHKIAAQLGLERTSQLVSATVFSGYEAFLHSLAYYFVTSNGPGPADYDFTSVEINWGTKYITTEVIGKMWAAALAAAMRATTDLYLAPTNNPSLVGYLFAGWAIQKLSLGGLTGMHWTAATLANRSRFMTTAFFGNGDAFKHNFPIEYVAPASMGERLRLAAPRVLIVPTSFNYPVIDCVLKGGTAEEPLYASVQVIVAHTHETAARGEDTFTALMNAVFSNVPVDQRAVHIRDRTAVFYCVPPLAFKNFHVLKITTYPGGRLKLTL